METVSDVCRKTGVTRKQLFYYDRIGLLKPTKRVGPQKAKLYGAKAIERLNQILLYQKAGLRLSEIARILDGNEDEKAFYLNNAIERLRTEASRIDTQIAFAKSLLDTLPEKEEPPQ